MSTWHWVRHGPTHAKAFVGWRDLPADLSDTAHLKRISDGLPEDAVVLSSDLRRCVATADAIAGTRDRLPNDPHLREFHFGTWDGVHFAQVAEAFPDLSRAYWETPGDHAPPGGESWNRSAHRVDTAVQRWRAHGGSRDVIAVAHFGVILTQVQRVLGLSAAEVLAHKIDNLSVTTLDYVAGTARINQTL